MSATRRVRACQYGGARHSETLRQRRTICETAGCTVAEVAAADGENVARLGAASTSGVMPRARLVTWDSERANSIGTLSADARFSWKVPSRDRMMMKSTFSTPSTTCLRSSNAQNSVTRRGAEGVPACETG